MICPKCGQDNNDGSTFCIKCGTNLKVQELKNEEEVTAAETTSAPEPTPEPVVEPAAPAPEAPAAPVAAAPKTGFNLFAYVIAAFLKPFTSFKKEEDNLKDAKTAFTFAGIMVAALTVVNFIFKAIDAVFTKQLDMNTFKMKTVVDFGNMGNLDYVDIFVKYPLIVAGVILGIAGLVYIAKLIIKKETNYIKNVSIVTTALIPYLLCTLIVTTIFSWIWSYLGIAVGIASLVYIIAIFTTLINSDLDLKEDARIYFNLAIFATLFIAAYIIVMEVVKASLISGLSL